jgi:hypothetical protein
VNDTYYTGIWSGNLKEKVIWKNKGVDCEGKIKMNLKQTAWQGAEWTCPAEDRDK